MFEAKFKKLGVTKTKRQSHDPDTLNDTGITSNSCAEAMDAAMKEQADNVSRDETLEQFRYQGKLQRASKVYIPVYNIHDCSKVLT